GAKQALGLVLHDPRVPQRRRITERIVLPERAVGMRLTVGTARVPVHGPRSRTVNRRLGAGDNGELREREDEQGSGAPHRPGSGETEDARARLPDAHEAFAARQAW